MNAYDQDMSVLETHRKVLKEMAIKEAREQFLCGLRSELEAATRTANPSTLTEAIDIAVTNENNRGPRNSKRNIDIGAPDEAKVRLIVADDNIPTRQPNNEQRNMNDIRCTFCNRFGHETIECRIFRKKIISDHESITQNSIQSAQSDPEQQKINNIHCTFCNRFGHEIVECRTFRRRVINDNEITVQNQNQRNREPTYNYTMSQNNY